MPKTDSTRLVSIVIITEGSINRVVERPKDAVDAYKDGFSAGASAYGAGGFGVYTDTEEDIAEMREFENDAVVEKALKIFEKARESNAED